SSAPGRGRRSFRFGPREGRPGAPAAGPGLRGRVPVRSRPAAQGPCRPARFRCRARRAWGGRWPWWWCSSGTRKGGGLGVLPLTTELDEDRDLLADDLRIERLDQIVGAARGVGPVNLFRVLSEGGDEDDGDVAAALQRLEMGGHLQAIHPGQGHVDQGGGKAVTQREAQCLLARGGTHQAIVRALQDRRERGEILRL